MQNSEFNICLIGKQNKSWLNEIRIENVKILPDIGLGKMLAKVLMYEFIILKYSHFRSATKILFIFLFAF